MKVRIIPASIITDDASLIPIAESLALAAWEGHNGSPYGLDTWHGSESYDLQLDQHEEGGAFTIALYRLNYAFKPPQTCFLKCLLSADVELFDDQGRICENE